MKVHEILKKAKTLIEERGWWRGPLDSPCGQRLCPITAISAAVRDEDLQIQAMFFLDERLSNRVENWNDHPKRTKEEVLELLVRAANTAESQGV